jgi:hypothetical protein
MREYKFRAWDKEQKRMFDLYGLDKDHVYEQSLNDYTDSVHPRAICEINQWTEIDNIFEGDILFFPELNKHTDVYFQDGSFRILLPGEDESINLTEQFLDANYVEVAGNVYENPEMLVPKSL